MNKNNENIIDAGFIGDFKLGDNINYNLKILKFLYDKDKEENSRLLNKPVTIVIISIIEGLLRDFFLKPLTIQKKEYQILN